MSKLFLASSNQGKLKEIQSLLADMNLTLLTPAQLNISVEVEERGVTYEENAAIKALAYARESGLLTLADDSGLEVDVLGGLPGIRSARFSTIPNATDADRRKHLLYHLQGYSRPWLAHCHCTVAIATPQDELFFADGDCPGEIIPEERGLCGFGYDHIFLLPKTGRTMAELAMEEKNKISHRARAVKACRPLLTKLIRGYK